MAKLVAFDGERPLHWVEVRSGEQALQQLTRARVKKYRRRIWALSAMLIEGLQCWRFRNSRFRHELAYSRSSGSSGSFRSRLADSLPDSHPDQPAPLLAKTCIAAITCAINAGSAVAVFSAARVARPRISSACRCEATVP